MGKWGRDKAPLRATRGKITRNPERGNKIVPQLFTLEEIQDASRRMEGFCVACGSTVETCEPDARKRPCPSCGLRLGYGAEECFVQGWVCDDDGNRVDTF